MSLGLEVAIVLLLILLNAAFALSELALVSARRARLAVLERKGVPGAALARRLADDPQLFLPTIQAGNTLLGILSGVFGGARIATHVARWLAPFAALAPFAETIALALTVMAITYLTMVLGELVPKQLALRRPEQAAVAVARPIAWLARLGAPFVSLLSASSSLVLRAFGLGRATRQTVTEEELKALLAEGAQAGVLETEEREMIERLLRLADKPVRAIMTPRTELAWIDRTDPPREIAETLRRGPHSRFVVCDGAIDNVAGIVQSKDLLDRLLGGGDLSIAAALRQPIVVPDTATALDALERLKADPLGMALVIDEYGSFEGVVTADDVLRAIIGDTWAEGWPDAAAETGAATLPGATEPEPAELALDGMTPVDELKARLNLPDLPAEGSYHTTGGLLLALLRRVPRPGDRIVFAGWRFEVLEMDGRRVERIRASREFAGEG